MGAVDPALAQAVVPSIGAYVSVVDSNGTPRSSAVRWVGGATASGHPVLGDDDGHVVLAAAVERLLEQMPRGHAGVVVLEQDLGDRRVVDHLVEPVAAQQQPVAVVQRNQRRSAFTLPWWPPRKLVSALRFTWRRTSSAAM